MIWLLLLQMYLQPVDAFDRHGEKARRALDGTYLVEFERYVEEARRKLEIARVPVEVSTRNPWAAWVPYGPGADWVIYVRPDFLRESPPQTRRVVAIHECCHLYLGNNRRYLRSWEEELLHALVDSCVGWVLGPEWHSTMYFMPCNDWYPDEATRYNIRVRGRERCVEKRVPLR